MLKAWIGGALSALGASRDEAAKQTAHDFTLTGLGGQPLPLADYKDKVLLVVNTASKCGFTPQYEGLEKLHETYGPKGFSVIGVPSGDFLGQEFGSAEEIEGFCETRFGVKFPLTEKSHVVGADASPFYKWAAAILGWTNIPKWNFHKYLVGKDGKLIRAFSTSTAPEAPEVKQAIEAALAA